MERKSKKKKKKLGEKNIATEKSAKKMQWNVLLGGGSCSSMIVDSEDNNDTGAPGSSVWNSAANNHDDNAMVTQISRWPPKQRRGLKIQLALSNFLASILGNKVELLSLCLLPHRERTPKPVYISDEFWKRSEHTRRRCLFTLFLHLVFSEQRWNKINSAQIKSLFCYSGITC